MKRSKISNCYEIPLSNFIDSRGTLQVVENIKDLDDNLLKFSRCYILKNLKANTKRGVHAHKKLYQIFLIFNGSCSINLFDGENTKKIKLTGNKALLVVPGIWRELGNFSENIFIVVLASELYDKSDYIFQRNEFLKYKKNTLIN